MSTVRRQKIKIKRAWEIKKKRLLRRAQSRDLSVIPPGIYCYTGLSIEYRKKGYPVYHIKPCPYWGARYDMPEQERGYCALLNRGDWEDPYSFGLLWDQCKECGINDDFEDEK